MNHISIPELYSLYLKHPKVTTDTRSIKPGDLFFALKGPNFDGNQFARQAIENGAAYCVVDDPALESHSRLLQVENVLQALQDLARHHRQQLQIPVLAITGSNGKTTTKELIHAVLASHFKTYTTQGNLNNHIGIPLTLLRIGPDAEIAVIEMGANHLHEIESYCQYALPTHGLITNCGKAHLEGFGSEEGVRKGKGELFDFLRQTQGEAFCSSDLDYLVEMVAGIDQIHWYGTVSGEIQGHILENEPHLRVEINEGLDHPVTIHTNLVGSYNLQNVLAACAVGKHFKVPAAKIRQAIEDYHPTNSRSQLIEKNGNRIILDAYNANPSSMALAIENFAQIAAPNKILCLGAMKELGDTSVQEHENLVNQISKQRWNEVVLVGGDFEKSHGPYRYFELVEDAAQWYREQNFTDCYVLVKGSRTTKMEKIIN